MLGKPLMPWQQYVADVALEIDPATSRLAYTECRLTVPRRSGKTTLVLSKAVHRCSATGFFGPSQRLVYTAQTRKDAKKRFKEDYEPDLLAARRLKAKPSWSPGDEHIRFPNRSRFGIESTTEKAGHGDTLDEAYIDECFALVDNRVEQSFGPPMLTRANTQMWPISTAGWLDGSPYLEAKVKHGRDLVETGEPARTAYFEWSAPQDADPMDRAVWRECMPALGITFGEDDIAAEYERLAASPEGVNGFRRAYLNQWVPKFATANAVPRDRWEACADATSVIASRPVLAVSMTSDHQWVTLAVAGKRADGLLHVEIVADGRHGDWFVPRVAEVARRHGAEVVLHPGHAVGSLVPQLADERLRLNAVSSADYVRGCGAFYDLVVEERLRYPAPQPELDSALRKATQKHAENAWKWSGDGITALVAATQALFGAASRPETTSGGYAIGFS